jgi:RNA polymerase primary sigma factor
VSTTPVQAKATTTVATPVKSEPVANTAAAFSNIDTSNYVLSGSKEPAKRGRKPSEFQFENDEIQALNAAESAELKRAARAKVKNQVARSMKSNWNNIASN